MSTVVAVVAAGSISTSVVHAAPPAGVRSPAADPAAPRTTADTVATIRNGDSFAAVATRFDVGVRALLRANDMTLATVIHPGDEIVIPAGALVTPLAPTAVRATGASSAGVVTPVGAAVPPPVAPPIAAGATSYVVRGGDALSGIAWRHGVTLGALVTANGLTTASVILPGQTLAVPPATRPIPVAVPLAAAPAAATASAAVSTAPAASPAPVAAAAADTSIDTLVAFLRSQVGVPYRFFAAGPDAYDCSGLVVAAFRQIGVSVPHQSRALAGLGTSIDWKTSPIVAGDLVFTSAVGDPTLITHVGIAIDSTTWIHAVGVGRTVSVGNLPTSGRIMAVQRLDLP